MVCGLCGHRHNAAHRCPVFRLNPAVWVRSDDVNDWPYPVPVHVLSEFDVVCPHCRARSWREENINCCGQGLLQLPYEDNVPAELADVILSAHVRAHIRRYYVGMPKQQLILFSGTTCHLLWRQ